MFVSRKTNSWNSFSSFSHVWQQHGKLVNGNLIPVNTENATLTEESVFLLIEPENTFLFFHYTHFSQILKSRSLSFRQQLGSSNKCIISLEQLEALKSQFLSNHFRYLFHLLFPLCLFSSPLCFYLLRSVRIMA